MLDHRTLAKAYRVAKARCCSKGTNGKTQRWDDPISCAIRAAAQVGWSFTSLVKLQDQHGHDMNLLEGSPALFGRKFAEAWRVAAERAAGQRFEEKGLVPAGQHVCAFTARQLLHTQGKDRLTLPERQAMMRLFAGSYITAADLAR